MARRRTNKVADKLAADKNINRRLTNDEVLSMLADADKNGLRGKTLIHGLQWDGRDLPGRGKAAARRLRQQEKLNAKRVQEG